MGVVYLFPRDGILQEAQMCKFRELPQRVEISQFREVVGGQDESREIRDGIGQVWLYLCQAISGEEEG